VTTAGFFCYGNELKFTYEQERGRVGRGGEEKGKRRGKGKRGTGTGELAPSNTKT
jgi:hypothetical protein